MPPTPTERFEKLKPDLENWNSPKTHSFKIRQEKINDIILAFIEEECRRREEAERERTLRIINKGLVERGSPIRVVEDEARNLYVKN